MRVSSGRVPEFRQGNQKKENQMNRRTFLKTVPALAVMTAKTSGFAEDTAATSSPAQALQPITLLKPQRDGGKSVLAALWERRTIRNISEKALPPQVLSDLLWAAWGANREGGPTGRPGRTAASASNSQEIDLYVALPEGIYLYEAIPHRLTPVVAGDQRAKVSRSRRGAGSKAPVHLIFVADIARYSKARFQEPGLKDPEIQKSYYNVAVGLVAGNVYLFAASQGLAAWFHNCNKTGLAAELKLRPEHHVLYAQTVGYPA
jgi:nitroreductase